MLHQVSSMKKSLSVPISTKLRLCTPTSQTSLLASRLAAQGASWITLHARHVSARRRRAGAADLSVVKDLVERGLGIPVVSNGNVRTWEDIALNRRETGADGVMVGETLLANPWFVRASFLFGHFFALRLNFIVYLRTWFRTRFLYHWNI